MCEEEEEVEGLGQLPRKPRETDEETLQEGKQFRVAFEHPKHSGVSLCQIDRSNLDRGDQEKKIDRRRGRDARSDGDGECLGALGG